MPLTANPSPMGPMPHNMPTNLSPRNIPLENLPNRSTDVLPLHVQVDSAVLDHGPVVYSIHITNVVMRTSWCVSHRFSELRDFKHDVCTKWTCTDKHCEGSCRAIQECLDIWFPHRLPKLASKSSLAIKHRCHRVQDIFVHLLRSMLLPGSAMKCWKARNELFTNVFDFLNVPKTMKDRRSVVQVYVDDLQPSLQATATYEDECIVCFEMMEDLPEVEGEERVILPCHHAFHRDCVSHWLQFEFVCPMCRMQVLPSTVSNYCQAKDGVSWWLDEFDEDPLNSHRN